MKRGQKTKAVVTHKESPFAGNGNRLLWMENFPLQAEMCFKKERVISKEMLSLIMLVFPYGFHRVEIHKRGCDWRVDGGHAFDGVASRFAVRYKGDVLKVSELSLFWHVLTRNCIAAKSSQLGNGKKKHVNQKGWFWSPVMWGFAKSLYQNSPMLFLPLYRIAEHITSKFTIIFAAVQICQKKKLKKLDFTVIFTAVQIFKNTQLVLLSFLPVYRFAHTLNQDSLVPFDSLAELAVPDMPGVVMEKGGKSSEHSLETSGHVQKASAPLHHKQHQHSISVR